MIIELQDGTRLEIADGLGEDEILRIIEQYQQDVADTRSEEDIAASNARRDQLIAQQEANADPTVAFDRVRPRYLDGVLGEEGGRSFDAGMMGWAEQADDIVRGFKNLFADESEEERLALEAELGDQFAQSTYRGSNGLAADVGEFATTAPMMFLPGGLIVQSLLGGAEQALDQNSGDNMGLDFITGTATAGTFGKFFDLAGRLVKNTGGRLFGDDGRLTGELGEQQQKAVQFADEEGVPTLPSQRDGNSGREQFESKMESQPYGQPLRDIRENQSRELNRIFFQRFGIDGATEYSGSVRKAVDEKITNAFKEIKAEIPTTSGDDIFLDGAVDITTRKTLTPEQVKILEDIALEVADGMPAQKLLDVRKQLQTAVVGNFNKGESVYAGALRDMVDEIDNLVERTASTETAMKYADARDMSRMRMALEMGASTNAKGEVNATSLANRLYKIYKNELGRGRGGLRPDTQRSVNAAEAASIFKTSIGNSGTQTRAPMDLTNTLVDIVARRPLANQYLRTPGLYGSFDPMSQLAESAALNYGRAVNDDYEELKDSLLGPFQ